MAEWFMRWKMETVIYNTLKEEKQRNLERQDIYRSEIEGLRKGKIIVKMRSGKPYHYLLYRDGDKVKTDYIGADNNKVQEIKREIERRKYVQEVLERLKIEYKQICKIVKE